MVAPQQPYPQQQRPSLAPGAPGAPGPGPAPARGGSGTSKIVPVVVSAGLAVGVFAGLLFGLGTGEEAHAGRRASGSGSAVMPTIDVSTEEFEGSEKVAVVTPDAGPVSAGPDGGAVATVDGGTSAQPAIKLARVTFAVVPPGASAKITLDGKPVETEAEIDISAGPKSVELVVQAAGFRDYKKKFDITQDDSLTIELVKRGGGGGTTTSTPPTTRPPTTRPPTTRPPKKKSDKIDI